MSKVSKYIRTEDGIYKCADYLGIHDGKRYALMDDAQGNRITMCQRPEELCRVADNLRELCDEFVLKVTLDGNSEYQISKNLYLLKISKITYDSERKYLTEIYGSIWIDDELHKVAKMNEKGKLELL